MINVNISAYLLLEQLPELKNISRKGIMTPRKQPRYDLVEMAGFYPAIDKLKNYKGKLFFNLISGDKNETRKKGRTVPEYYLQCTPANSKSINFSGLRFQYVDGKPTPFASGEPSDQFKLKGGIINPLYDQKNDGFLFLFSSDKERLEILIVDNGKLFIDAYRKQLFLGGLDEVLNQSRNQAKAV